MINQIETWTRISFLALLAPGTTNAQSKDLLRAFTTKTPSTVMVILSPGAAVK
jgi:hypothetical protein